MDKFKAKLNEWIVALAIALPCSMVILWIGGGKMSSESQENILYPLVYSLFQISSKEAGISNWEPGEAAIYEIVNRSQSRLVPNPPLETNIALVMVITNATPQNTSFWLAYSNFLSDRGKPKWLFKLATPTDNGLNDSLRLYSYVNDYVPFNETGWVPARNPQKQVTPSRVLEINGVLKSCSTMVVELGAERIELALHEDARPLGIVYAKNKSGEEIRFRAVTNIVPRWPDMMQHVIVGKSYLQNGCTSCHGATSCKEKIYPPL